MTSLYKRATPAQVRILRIVEGAIKNAVDVHPEIQISPRHRRSIAKRAAGTLTACWPEVLAARGSSDSEAAETSASAPRRSSQRNPAAGRGASHFSRRSPLRRLEGQIASQLRALKADGRDERVTAFIEVLRMISKLRLAP